LAGVLGHSEKTLKKPQLLRVKSGLNEYYSCKIALAFSQNRVFTA
ncbi:MAG: hypothetical protein RLZZ73_586, partial [Actinomycetota bacterium]